MIEKIKIKKLNRKNIASKFKEDEYSLQTDIYDYDNRHFIVLGDWAKDWNIDDTIDAVIVESAYIDDQGKEQIEYQLKKLKSTISDKSRTAAAIIAVLGGVFGLHRFYVSRNGTAFLFLLLGILCFWLDLLWLISIVVWIDIVMILIGKFKDKNGNLVLNWSGTFTK